MKKKKRSQLPKGQKMIHRHFKRRTKTTLSKILQAGSNSRRTKELLQNNRALAAELVECRTIMASNARMIQSYNVASTQVFMAQRKLKDMASTLQKVVGDLDAALNYLDVSHLISSTIFSNDFKTGSCPPELETIEESPRSSVASNEVELMEDSTPVFDDYVTEIYNVTNFLNLDKQNGSEENNVSTIRTPEMPQFSPPKYTSKMPDFVYKKPKDLEGKEFTKETTPKAKTSSNLSRIPVRRHNLFCDLGIPDTPEAFVPSIRRETFVVNQLNKDNNDCLPVSVKSGTDSLQELAHELQATKKADSDKRGTFVIPHLPPQKPDPRPGNPFQLPNEICTGDMTLNFVEDMDLTEIIPSVALASSTYEMHFNNFSLPSNKTACNLKALPSVSNISKPISPIEKFKPSPNLSIVSSDKPGSSMLKKGKVVSKCFEEGFVPESSNLKPTNKISNKLIGSNSLNEAFKHPTISTPPTVNTGSPEYCHKSVGQSVSSEELLKQQKLSIDPIIAVESDLDVINERKKSNRASRKSVLPYPAKGVSKQTNQTNDADDLEEVHECRRSKTSKMTVLPNFLKKSPSYQNLSSNHDLSEETDSEAKDKQNKSSKASIKSLLPNPKELLNQLNLSDNIDLPDTAHTKTTNEVMSLDEITRPSYSTEKTVVNIEHSKEPEVSNSKSTKKNLKKTSSICPRKSVLSKISENSSNSENSSFSDMFPSDSEPEVIATEQQRKRIPGRRSLKPGRRGPFIFKKTRTSNSKLNKLECADSKGYDFSLSDEDEEPTTKCRQSKKPPKKSSKMPKNKNTVAVLERDIGLMYQEQGRKKRSLKKKVSFANINATPTNSDGEDRVKNSEREIKTLDDMFEPNDCEKKSAPARRSMLKKPSLPAEKSYISHNTSPNIEHKLKSSFPSTDESEEELRSKKNEKSEEIEKQTNKKVKGRSQGDGLLNVTDKKMDGEPKETETDYPLIAATHVDKIDVSKKSSLNVKQGKSSSKLSGAKSHKNSEFFGFESKRSKSKKTFSGISERSSRKRVTATDDFLDDVDIPFPEENPNGGASDIKSLSSATQSTHTSLAKPPIDNLNAEDVAVENETSNADVAPSSDKESEASTVVPKTPVFVNVSSKKISTLKRNKKTKTPTSSDVLSEVKENARKSKSKNVLKENIKDSAFTPPPSKARKTDSTGSLKENFVVPDLESGGRSRRNRPTVNFKEPSLNRKLRRN